MMIINSLFIVTINLFPQGCTCVSLAGFASIKSRANKIIYWQSIKVLMSIRREDNHANSELTKTIVKFESSVFDHQNLLRNCG
jgi:dihydroorotase